MCIIFRRVVLVLIVFIIIMCCVSYQLTMFLIEFWRSLLNSCVLYHFLAFHSDLLGFGVDPWLLYVQEFGVGRGDIFHITLTSSTTVSR